MLEFVDSDLYFVQDKNNFINPLLQVGSEFGSGSVEKSTGSGSGGLKINGSDGDRIRIRILIPAYVQSSLIATWYNQWAMQFSRCICVSLLILYILVSSSLPGSVSATIKITFFSFSGLPSWQDPRQTDQYVHRPDGPTPRRDSTFCLTTGAQLTNNSFKTQQAVSTKLIIAL